MARRCGRCGYENPTENDVITIYPGKMLCDCKNGNINGKECKIKFPEKQSAQERK